ncbi:MAG: RNA pseudouridine synthase [Spirochaetales bacterium]|nr:RNA pseudouridine synthase [Spirochaetales bacterium]
MSSIVFQNPDIVIADKDHGIPTVPLKRQTSMVGTLLGEVAAACPEILDVKGRNEWEFGTLHRLDTATSGLVVFARNQRTYDHLQRMQADDRFTKSYTAHVTESDRLTGKDIPDAWLESLRKGDSVRIESYFRAYGPGSREVRPIRDIRRSDNSVKYTTLAKRSGDLFTCTITRGFRHQIRAHLAWLGFPILGDALYGEGKEGETLELDCFSVTFPTPEGSLFSFSR